MIDRESRPPWRPAIRDRASARHRRTVDACLSPEGNPRMIPASGRKARRTTCLTWSEAEWRVLEKIARKVIRGVYPDARSAVSDLQAELSRLRRRRPTRARKRTDQAVWKKLLLRSTEMGRVRPKAAWLPPEQRLLDRFARSVADGKHRTASEAADPCVAALADLRRRHQGMYRCVPPRTRDAVLSRLRPAATALRSARLHTVWTAAETGIADRFVRSLLSRRYDSVRVASVACCETINAHHRRRNAKRSTGRQADHSARTPGGVYRLLRLRLDEAARHRLPYRRWTSEERRVSLRWGRRYQRHRQGQVTADITTLAKMMKAELDRRGYFRGVHACRMELVKQADTLAGVPERQRRRR